METFLILGGIVIVAGTAAWGLNERDKRIKAEESFGRTRELNDSQRATIASQASTTSQALEAKEEAQERLEVLQAKYSDLGFAALDYMQKIGHEVKIRGMRLRREDKRRVEAEQNLEDAHIALRTALNLEVSAEELEDLTSGDEA